MLNGTDELAPKLGRLAADLVLDRIERSDLGQGLACSQRGMDRA